MKNEIIKFLGGYTKKEYADMKLIATDANTEASEYLIENKKILSSIYPHNTLAEFKTHGISFDTKNKYYKAEFSDGKGYSFRRLHAYLKRTPEETEEFAKLSYELSGKKFHDIDTPIYNSIPKENVGKSETQMYIENILRNLQEKYTFKYKRESTESFLTPEEILNMLSKGLITDDCDGVSFSIFHLLDSFLETYYPDERWRLRSVIGVFYGQKGEGHAFNLWVNENFNDWSIIESTMWPERRMYTFNAPFRYNTQYLVRWSFDTDNEYPKLYK